MKRLVRRHSIYAMARIGYTDDRIELRIYTDDPGSIPHLHFKSDNLDGCIRLDKAEYFPHNRHTSTLNSRQVRSLVRFLKSYNSRWKMSNWDVVVKLWNDNNSDVEIDDSAPMPDYLNGLNK